MLLALSELACELPEVRELDINPLVVDAHGVVAVDVRVQLRPAYEATLPGYGEGRYNHCAIEPYPNNLVRSSSSAMGSGSSCARCGRKTRRWSRSSCASYPLSRVISGFITDWRS